MWSIGIPIVGSLYWSTEQYRVAWRCKCSNMNRVVPVKAPIRYGRKSHHGSYTMVFAPGSPVGQAKVVGCQRQAISITDILSQAEALWLAERPPDVRPIPGQLNSASWGCVAILLPPNSKISADVLSEWAKRVAHLGRLAAKPQDWPVVRH
jgi:hypothetical protein